ncbi:DUF4087 domain-containing protein [Rhizobium sp. WSM1274]|uniref:DUF4087 domain-containing protein n=1 Tax=Rhizobium TaxID=379 RepID=UPI001C93D25A|nr:DUF4087 domain-containing protein [Rhizobium leguminosarum]MBY5400651.1 DUF4087 domain-containing protein [Rhizobium leguminosarum]UWM73822.1 DUF4087 domain-containing protein [Rhizobium leguminosarum bv. viciae]UWM79780.1 DUF4087 domain-containing protein [Rhizobium leguminosarum bv. viciae]UWU26537.1 DUF4087 domain-containing protein [Rhizobium leguminosarum bv. viciae]
MKYQIAAAVMIAALVVAANARAAETRCGWIENPTPANWWLEDAENTWTIMTQGDDAGEVEGMELIPDISEHDYVRTNGTYGYACACVSVETDGKDRITRILSFRQLKLAKCRADRALKFPG